MTGQADLIKSFRKQHEFTRGYSPLCSKLCQLFCRWLEEDREPFTKWLLETAADRVSFDVPMLINAGLHYLVLQEFPPIEPLAAYYPSAGGQESVTDPLFGEIVYQAVLEAADELHHFIRTANVQTNETARGLCWLLPLSYMPWKRVRLIELGASAGLNLVADERCYRLQDERSSEVDYELGWGKGEQFIVSVDGKIPRPPFRDRIEIISRTGCDKAPFHISGPEDENLLTSFIWADQINRLARLREGIVAADRLSSDAGGPVVECVNLADGIVDFLHSCVGGVPCPVVLFHTYVTKYLKDRGAVMERHINDWATGYGHDVLWVQMELPDKTKKAPVLGWLLWKAQFYQHGKCRAFDLGWVHPHGSHVRLLPGMDDWCKFWKESK